MTHHLVGVHEVAKLLQVKRQRVHQLAKEPGFPKPTVILKAGQVWNRADIEAWRQEARAASAEGAKVPERDPDRPQDDPWDAAAVRYLLSTPEGRTWRRGDLMECLREQPNRVRRQPERVAEAARLADTYDVERRPDPGGKTVHFFRKDVRAPSYPRSSVERRSLLRTQLERRPTPLCS
jgi:predicted DNA-binding transcriptional regulator AlpA